MIHLISIQQLSSGDFLVFLYQKQLDQDATEVLHILQWVLIVPSMLSQACLALHQTALTSIEYKVSCSLFCITGQYFPSSEGQQLLPLQEVLFCQLDKFYFRLILGFGDQYFCLIS